MSIEAIISVKVRINNYFFKLCQFMISVSASYCVSATTESEYVRIKY